MARALAIRTNENMEWKVSHDRYQRLFRNAERYPDYPSHSIEGLVSTIEQHEMLLERADIKASKKVDLFSDPRIPKSKYSRREHENATVYSGEIFDQRRDEIIEPAIRTNLDIHKAGRDFADYINLETSESAEQVVAEAKLETVLSSYGDVIWEELSEEYTERVEKAVFCEGGSWIEEADFLLEREEFEDDRIRAERTDEMIDAVWNHAFLYSMAQNLNQFA